MRLAFSPLRPCHVGLLALGLAPLSPAQIVVPDHFPTIQAAVDAASGGTILIRAGNYAEQVVIDSKDLNLIGLPGTVLVPPPGGLAQTGLPFSESRPIVTIIRSHVTMRGLTVDGQVSGNTNPGLVGAHYLGSGGEVSQCHFTGVRDPSVGDGEALLGHNPQGLGTDVVTLRVRDNTFDNNRNSITMVGHAFPMPNLGVLRLSVSVFRNTVTGVGLRTGTNQTGILVFSDAGGAVVGNTVTDHFNEGALFASTGIIVGLPFIPGLLPFSGAQQTIVALNTVRNCRDGVLVFASDGMWVVGNRIVGPGRTIAGTSGIGVTGVGNHFIGNKLSASENGFNLFGTELFGGAFGIAQDTQIIGNRISDTVNAIVEGGGVTGTVLRWNRITN